MPDLDKKLKELEILINTKKSKEEDIEAINQKCYMYKGILNNKLADLEYIEELIEEKIKECIALEVLENINQSTD